MHFCLSMSHYPGATSRRFAAITKNRCSKTFSPNQPVAFIQLDQQVRAHAKYWCLEELIVTRNYQYQRVWLKVRHSAKLHWERVVSYITRNSLASCQFFLKYIIESMDTSHGNYILEFTTTKCDINPFREYSNTI